VLLYLNYPASKSNFLCARSCLTASDLSGSAVFFCNFSVNNVIFGKKNASGMNFVLIFCAWLESGKNSTAHYHRGTLPQRHITTNVLMCTSKCPRDLSVVKIKLRISLQILNVSPHYKISPKFVQRQTSYCIETNGQLLRSHQMFLATLWARLKRLATTGFNSWHVPTSGTALGLKPNAYKEILLELVLAAF